MVIRAPAAALHGYGTLTKSGNLRADPSDTNATHR